MTIITKEILDFVYKRWKNEDGENGVYDSKSEEFNKIVNEAFQDLTKDVKNTEKIPYLIRIAGQAGSGKTTQLMPAIKNNLDAMNKDYILVAVRLFSKYHPNYDELLKKYGSSLIREKTNGFALILLIKVIEKLIKGKYNILFEVTLLEPEFEEYIVKLSKENNYRLIYNILSIASELSNKWIEKRQKNSIKESNRVVFKSSSSYFYEILPKAVEKLYKIRNNFNKNDYIVMWNAIDKLPCLCTNIFDENVLITLNKYRKMTNIIEDDEYNLLNHKVNFYKNFFKNINLLN